MTDSTALRGTDRVKRGLADMLKGGVIMDVVTPDPCLLYTSDAADE